MKAYRRIAHILLGLAVMIIFSCSNKFDEINRDPNRATEVQTYSILTMLERNIAYNYFDSWQGLRMNGVIAQQWAQRTYTDEDRYNFAGRTSTVANFFTITYTYTELANQILLINDKNPGGASAYGDNKLQIATVKILRAWLIFQNCETFGDVPYTEANDIFTYPRPKYDKQEDVFKGLINELKEINTSLQGVTRGWTSGDVLLGGNPDKWRRFANSLRMVIAMRMSNVEPAFSASEADAAINDGVLRDNADNAVFRFLSAGDPNESSLYNTFLSRMDFLPSWQFVNLLHGRNDDNIGFENPFNGVFDPRFIQFVQSPADQRAGLTPRVDAIPMGLSPTDNNRVWGILPTETRITYGPTSGRADDVLPKPIQAAFWSTFMDYPNVALFMAERELVKGNATECRNLFEKGIQASLSVWGVPETDATNYLTAVLDKFDAATNEGKFEMIITQKYIHNFGHFEQETVFEYRRTEYPKSVILPGQVTGGDYPVGEYPKGVTSGPRPMVTLKFLPTGSIFMQRMMYSTNEYTTNKENVTNAAKAMGGDDQSIPLYYSKKYKK